MEPPVSQAFCVYEKMDPFWGTYEQSHPPEHCATFQHVTSSLFQLRGKPVFHISNRLGFVQSTVYEKSWEFT